jgi:HEPN domain-containing protein
MSDLNLPLIKAWILKAEHDLGSAKVIFEHIPEYFDTIAFHCQQAVEKYLKAALVNYNIEFERSHDLLYLLELLSRNKEISSDIFDKAIVLNGFSVEIRYPDKLIYLTHEELKRAINIAEEFRELILELLKIERHGKRM